MIRGYYGYKIFQLKQLWYISLSHLLNKDSSSLMIPINYYQKQRPKSFIPTFYSFQNFKSKCFFAFQNINNLVSQPKDKHLININTEILCQLYDLTPFKLFTEYESIYFPYLADFSRTFSYFCSNKITETNSPWYKCRNLLADFKENGLLCVR